MSRRSTRLQTKGVEREDTPPCLPSSPIPKPKPARKKRKASTERQDDHAPIETVTKVPKAPAIWAKVRGRRGHLKLVVEMPFDILLEMFQYLTPIDLLTLSKANHAFRDLLLDRSTAFQLWKEAFSSVDPQPPACPDDMSLPQYANLLYGRTCFFCESIHGLTRSWVAYIRVCKHCLSGTNFVTVTCASKGTVEYDLNRMVAFLHDSETRQSRALRADYEKHRTNLNEVKDDEDSYNEYVREQSAKLGARQNRTGDFRGWEYTIVRMKTQDIKERRGTRKEAILERLEDLGYKGLLNRMGPWQTAKLPGLTGVKPLTDREWEKVRPSIVEALGAQQQEYDEQARLALVNRRTPLLRMILDYYFSHNRDMQYHGPPLSQVARLEPFRTIIYDTPVDQQPQSPDFMKRLNDLTPALKAWRASAEATLIGLIPISSTPAVTGQSSKAKGKAKECVPDASVLKLATTIFDCRWCGNLLVYPHVLDHPCVYRRHRPCQEKGFVASKRGVRNRRNDPAYQVIYYSEEDRSDPNVAWNEGGQQIRFYEDASKYAAAIIKALGKDPDTATWEELDRDNQRVECLRCQKPKASAHRRLAMDWRQAIIHQLNAENFKEFKEHALRTPGSFTYKTAWKKLNDASLEKALNKENPNSSEYGPPRCAVTLLCVECGMQTIGPNGTLEDAGEATIVDPGDVRCKVGHDLSKGTYIRHESSESFTTAPFPVKVP